ncbi:MAG: hypothetical protein LBG80_10285, partial [Bacteroidales bacterium]|nr:hypothetical protein [Bacteroidales bacterium]
ELYAFDAYGNAIGFDPSVALTEFLYSCEQFDSKIGQQYLRARYYNPATGRFNRLDPFFGNINDPLSLHKYLYSHADPVNGVDPSGYSFLSLVGGVLGGIAIRVQMALPTITAFTFAITKISFFTLLGSEILLQLEKQGWVPKTGITEPINALSGAIFLLAFTATEMMLGIPTSPVYLRSGRSGQVQYGSTGLSRQVQVTRVLNNISTTQSRNGNTVTPNGTAVFYKDKDGKIQSLVYFSGGRGTPGTHSHSERIMQKDLEAKGIFSSNVIEIYSERQPCMIPTPQAGCDAMLKKQFPNANITWSFQYGDTKQSRIQGNQELINAVQGINPQYLFNNNAPDPALFYGLVENGYGECFP